MGNKRLCLEDLYIPHVLKEITITDDEWHHIRRLCLKETNKKLINIYHARLEILRDRLEVIMR